MPPRKLASFTIAVLSAAFGACSDQSPVAPGPAPGAALQVGPLAQPVEGEGDISFVRRDLGEVTLAAYVTDTEGNLAQGGMVIFQFCALRELGFPSVPLPSAECESGGSARWIRAGAAPVVAGEASLIFCCVSSETILGFRFVYIGQGSGIGNFTILGQDYSPSE